jgi:hypothetical protein
VAFIADAFTAGQTLTAASMEALRGNANAGHNVFTTEAARDAAITAPTEGMMAYLTAPTSAIVTATGNTTAVPTGVSTIYNGSVWVCTTEVAANSPTDGTTTSGSYVTTLTGDGTAIAATLVTGTTALISLGAEVANNANAVFTHLSFSVSGATTLAASDENGVGMNHTANYWQVVSRVFVITGLTAGTNTFTLSYRVQSNTGTYSKRWLAAKGIV